MEHRGRKHKAVSRHLADKRMVYWQLHVKIAGVRMAPACDQNASFIERRGNGCFRHNLSCGARRRARDLRASFSVI